MSAASSVAMRAFGVGHATAAPAVVGARREPMELERRDRAHLRVRRRLRQPHDAIHQHALFGAPHFGFVVARRRLIERRLDQPVDHFAETGQRLIDGVLRHHAGRAIGLQHEADRDVGGDRRRIDRIERFARGAREQLAMQPKPGGRGGSRSRIFFGIVSSDGFSVADSASIALRCISPLTHSIGVRPSPRIA